MKKTRIDVIIGGFPIVIYIASNGSPVGNQDALVVVDTGKKIVEIKSTLSSGKGADGNLFPYVDTSLKLVDKPKRFD
ncbi:MAG: hypothetical protein WC791_00825 [Candidatus Paceibacterota bacterium]|jgi:hypothetical protein